MWPPKPLSLTIVLSHLNQLSKYQAPEHCLGNITPIPLIRQTKFWCAPRKQGKGEPPTEELNSIGSGYISNPLPFLFKIHNLLSPSFPTGLTGTRNFSRVAKTTVTEMFLFSFPRPREVKPFAFDHILCPFQLLGVFSI